MNQMISIIIPTFNRAHLIRETLDSIIAQSYSNWECIIVDDGSTDATLSILEEYQVKDPRFHFYERPSDLLQGGNAARNFGYSKSSGNYIQWFDSDDVMLKNYLKDRVSEFTSEIDFVICNGYTTDNSLNKLKERLIYQTNNLFKAYLIGNLRLITQSIIFKKKFLKGKQLFSENLQRGQENELFSRLFFKICEYQYIIIEKPLFLYRQHEETKSTQNKKTYIPSFKKSMACVLLGNLKRGLAIDDEQIINRYFRMTMDSYFEAIYANDLKTKDMIFKSIIRILINNNLYLALMFICNYFYFLLFKKNSYFVEKVIKNNKLK